MNAIQFIQQHGVDKARGVVNSASETSKFYCYEFKMGAISIRNNYSDRKDHMFTIDLSDLKRLVESVDLVESLGGVKGAETEAHNCRYYEYADLTHRARMIYEAVADYESIYGGEHV